MSVCSGSCGKVGRRSSDSGSDRISGGLQGRFVGRDALAISRTWELRLSNPKYHKIGNRARRFQGVPDAEHLGGRFEWGSALSRVRPLSLEIELFNAEFVGVRKLIKDVAVCHKRH